MSFSLMSVSSVDRQAGFGGEIEPRAVNRAVNLESLLRSNRL